MQNCMDHKAERKMQHVKSNSAFSDAEHKSF
eukprot:CAMPEP_0180133596 /NCGR_PEP_ID=MMETSP0986-20121125/9633_1 /TAXON_ID=697907 /ORGANISM="non described non described, Strain CCMP2293" /LENGTH=30 /DNA_ID= /DNA_START= /DNA_END= /DNA_ORIENTATION=